MIKRFFSKIATPFKSLFHYFSSSMNELKFIKWGNLKEVSLHTTIVVFVTAFVAVVFAGWDYVLQFVSDHIFK